MLMVSLCSADVDIVVNADFADSVKSAPLESLSNFVQLSSMDNSDLFVALCLPGTFSPNNEGVCHDCTKCRQNQYEKLACIPTRDRTCANCTVCGNHEIELCQCSVKTSQCVTGDRVCMKVLPSVVTLTVDLTSNGVLNSRQRLLIQSGMATGYVEWLSIQFGVDPDTIDMTEFVQVAPTQYKAKFTFSEVYGEATIRRINTETAEFYQEGLIYTFGGGRRRRLLSYSYGLVSLNGAASNCTSVGNCTEPFTEYQLNATSCQATCVPVPCPPGFEGGYKSCVLCGPGTFKNYSGFASCDSCPAGFSSEQGSTSSEQCNIPVTTTQSSESTGEIPEETTISTVNTALGEETTSSASATQILTANSQTSATTLSPIQTTTQTQTTTADLAQTPTTTADLAQTPTTTAFSVQAPTTSAYPTQTQSPTQTLHISTTTTTASQAITTTQTTISPQFSQVSPSSTTASPYSSHSLYTSSLELTSQSLTTTLSSQGGSSSSIMSTSQSGYGGYFPGGGLLYSGGIASNSIGGAQSNSLNSNIASNISVASANSNANTAHSRSDNRNVNNANNAITINVPSQAAGKPIFNNYVTVDLPPSAMARENHRHDYYRDYDYGIYDGDYFGIVIFMTLIVFGTCVLSTVLFPCCSCQQCYGEERDRRPIIRYRIIRDTNQADV